MGTDGQGGGISLGDIPSTEKSPSYMVRSGDAFDLPLSDCSVDTVVTSPPYWQKRDYGMDGQIGQEDSPEEYINSLMTFLAECDRVLHPTGSAFVNLGDTYRDRSLLGIPQRFAAAVRDSDWTVRNEITWVKNGGVPSPVDNRFTCCTESVFFLVKNPDDYYHDQFAYRERYGKTGDIWEIDMEPDGSSHLAPFPSALVERALLFGCPPLVCTRCNRPYKRIVDPSFELDTDRPQAKRAMERYQESNLDREHLEAVRATGLGMTGKTSEVQTGTGCNSTTVEELAAEAREVLGSYTREFVQPSRETVGWEPTCEASCSCYSKTESVEQKSINTITEKATEIPNTRPGVVLDPFVGTGTTVEAASRCGLSAIGTDLSPPSDFQLPLNAHFGF